MELDDELYKKIVKLCGYGDNLSEEERFDEAIIQYNKALELVPLPKSDWEAGTWIYSALGDVFFIKKDFQKSSNYFYNALNCPNGIDNSFILLRLGQSLLELGNASVAKEYLLKAYMVGGAEIFNDEEEKYFDVIIDII